MSATTDSGTSASLARRSVVVATGTLASRITGLVRVAVTLAVLGGTRLTDVYQAANTTPNIVYELLLGGVLTASLMPLFVRADAEHDDSATAAIFTFALGGLVVLCGIAVALAPWIARLFTANVPAAVRDDAYDVGTLLVICFMPQMLFYGFTALATAALNARRRFVAAAYAPVLNNVVVIAVMIAVRNSLGRCPSNLSNCTLHYADDHRALVLGLGIGTTGGIVAMAVALLPALRRARIRIVSFTAVWRHPAVRQLVRLSGWTIGYVVTNQLALAFILWLTPDKTSALTQYQSAYIFFQLPHGLIAVSIMTAIVPEFATAAHAGDFDALRRHFRTGLQWLLLTVTPAAAGYLALARPIVADTVGHGRFSTATAIAGMAHALGGFALGLVAFSVYLYTLRAFYACADTKTPFLVNALENAVNIAAAAVFFPLWGVGGLAGAYSLAYAVAAVVALVLLTRAIGPVVDREVGATFARALLASVVAAVSAWAVVHVWNTGVVALAVAALAGATLYVGAILALHEPTATTLLASVRGRGARRM